MTLKKLTSVLALLLCLLPAIFAQETADIHGMVKDKKTGEAIIAAAVQIKETGRWTITDEKGHFIFTDIISKDYTIVIKHLGYEDLNQAVSSDDYLGKELILKIVPTSFEMEEVNVLAKNGTKVASSTSIGNAAIEHIQATNLNDVMQLIPGNLSDNPNMSEPQKISIREIGTDDNSAMGTSIIIDNAPVSNNANMQSLNTTTIDDTYHSSAGTGIDLRQISTGNIESVEVIKGIPSVVYGDLTSGIVSVKTKAGYNPFSIKLKTDPKIKQASLEQGFKLHEGRSALNLNLDLLNSYKDVRSKYQGFQRISSQVAWSKIFFKGSSPLSFNAKLDYSGTIDNNITDPDALTPEEEESVKENSIRLNLNGKWSLNKRFISNLQYTFSSAYRHQVNYKKHYRSRSGGVSAVSLSDTPGENEGIYIPTEQLTELTIDGKPVNIFAQVTADLFNEIGRNGINKILTGIEFRLDGNYGEGQIYDISNPPFVSFHSSRPRSFKDIPPMRSVSVYLEDKLILPIGSTKLVTQAGIRLNNYQASGLFSSDIGFYPEPRLNIEYELLNKDNNSLFKILSISAGIGKTFKSPSLLHLYPDLAYYDFAVLDWYTDDPATRMILFNSYQFHTDNPGIKPSENLKKELGIDINILGISGNITFFDEKLFNGFNSIRHYEWVDAYRYNTESIPPGTKPDPSALPREEYEYILGYRKSVNNRETLKKGIEYSLNFGKINSLYTSFTLDGAWLRTTRIYSTTNYDHLPSSGTSEQFKEIGVYPAGESKISERLNSSLRMVTQVPRLRMILSTTMQIIWYNKYHYPVYNEVPLYLYDREGNITDFTDEMSTEPEYNKYVNDKSEFYYLTEKMPPLMLVNLRLSKEIANRMKLSLFANNFINRRPMYQYTRSESYLRRNPALYFGAELKIQL